MIPLTHFKKIPILPLLIALALVALASPASATLPPGNTVEQWNKIAEDTVVGSGAFQTEGLIYMSYASAAVYDVAVAIDGDFEPYGPPITAPPGASVDCAVVEAAYRTLRYYFSSFPSLVANLDAYYAEARLNFGGCTADGGAGTAVGLQAANDIIALRTGDGRMTPIGVTSSFPTLPPGPGVWRLTPPFQLPQTPWVGNVRRFILQSVDQFLPDPPPSLQSPEWVEAFNEVKAYGPATGSARTDEQTAIAKFWSANVIRQYNRAGRDVVDARGLGLLETARLAAMINLVGADAQMSNLHAKYHYLFWRPVTAINGSLDPTAVTNDGFGPEYPSAHGTLTSAMAEVFRALLGTNRIRPRYPRVRPCRASWKSKRGTALRHDERPPPRDHQRSTLGRAALPPLDRRRDRPGPPGRELRPQACLPTSQRLTLVSVTSRSTIYLLLIAHPSRIHSDCSCKLSQRISFVNSR